ncbi:MAG: Malonyl CoA-acyl carrier protein transacylase [Polyangiaceae bacterium]|nr:Malonyl CoA-acyl carrier protein transacylase [Polyangiaceae bacterium]
MTTAWFFPGQGTQKVGMGKELYASSAAAREVWERADAALGFSLKNLCFEGPESDLTLTKFAQPAIVTTSVAALAAIREALPSLPPPSQGAGHSLGEYSALVAAGALGFEDAVRLVHLRGQAMQEAVPEGLGGMAAIMGGDADAVSALCADAAQDEVVAPANFNAPGQIVISGHKTAVARAAALAGERKLKAIVLNVSAPFHCSLMAPAAERMKTALAQVAPAALAFPVLANVEAKPNQDASRVAGLLVQQVDSPVKWEQTVLAMAESGVTRALEIGPGKVLAGLAKRIDKRISVLSVGDAESVAKVAEFLAS